jgi:hypothetical protein
MTEIQTMEMDAQLLVKKKMDGDDQEAVLQTIQAAFNVIFLIERNDNPKSQSVKYVMKDTK